MEVSARSPARRDVDGGDGVQRLRLAPSRSRPPAGRPAGRSVRSRSAGAARTSGRARVGRQHQRAASPLAHASSSVSLRRRGGRRRDPFDSTSMRGTRTRARRASTSTIISTSRVLLQGASMLPQLGAGSLRRSRGRTGSPRQHYAARARGLVRTRPSVWGAMWRRTRCGPRREAPGREDVVPLPRAQHRAARRRAGRPQSTIPMTSTIMRNASAAARAGQGRPHRQHSRARDGRTRSTPLIATASTHPP